MRILLNTKPLVLSDKTGVGYYVFNLYQELLKLGVDVTPTLDTGSQVFVNFLSKISFYLRRLFPNWPPGIVKRAGDLFIGRLSKGNMAEPAYDIYHETSLDFMPENGFKRVLNLYDLSFLSCPEFLVEDFARYASENVTRNVLSADRIIVNTEFIKGEALHLLKVPEWKIDVIALAPSSIYHQADEYRVKPECITRLTKKDYILYVGTVEPRKNLKILIRAFKEIKERYDVSLIITGRFGWLYDDIVNYPEELGIRNDVIFTGYVDEETLRYLYNHASVFVYPSLYEGFGLPPLESMACGVPVIISDIPPLREVAGDAAIAFNPEDHEELAAMIDRVLSSESLRSDMMQRGFEKVNEYSWSKVAALTIETYKRAMES